MSKSHNDGRLSYNDSLFLYLEREGMPMNVASIHSFEGAIALEECRDYVESKLPLIPRYRQRLHVPPLNIGLPRWEEDYDFKIENHVHEVSLKRGTEAELMTLVSDIMSTRLDRLRPLWDLTLVHGLKGNRTGLISRAHHALMDGVSGIGLLGLLMDQSPNFTLVQKKTKRRHGPPPSDFATDLLEELISSCSSIAQHVLTAQSELLDLAHHVMSGNGRSQGGPASGSSPLLGVNDFATVVQKLAEPVERLPFNMVCRGPQHYRGATIPLTQICFVKEELGVTFNDVVLALVALSIRRYLQLLKVPLTGRRASILVPVRMRKNKAIGELGNQISFMPVPIPLNIRDPRRLVIAVHRKTTEIKDVHIPDLVGLAGTLLGIIPAPFMAYTGPTSSQLPLTIANLVCTNLPGPRTPLYLLGHKMLAFYPYVPIGGEMAFNWAVLSYQDTVYFGFTANVHAMPDLRQIEGFLKDSVANLLKAVGKTPKRQRHAAQVKKVQGNAAEGPALSSTAIAKPMPVASDKDRESLEKQAPNGQAA